MTALGQLSWAYASANESMEMLYFRVIRPDGSISNLAADAVQDLPAAVNQGAPAFSDLRERSLTVPGLSPGARLEFGYAVTLHTAHVPNQFWGQHRFQKQGACLSEVLEIRFPTDSHVLVKSKSGLNPVVSKEGDSTLHRWKHSHIDSPEQGTDEAAQTRRQKRLEEWSKDAKVPDIQFTTFRDWKEVGNWYAGLERPRRDGSVMFSPTTSQILKNQASTLDKVKALYGFLAKEFRYVSLSFGQGRFQPHPAAEVLANRYGDCKDKNLLLASMLEGIGLRPDLVLCSSFQTVDPEIPSPAQFDHLMLRVVHADDVLWLDPTVPLTPFRTLAPSLRGSRALVVSPNGASSLDTIPPEPSEASLQQIEISGSLSEDGTLSGEASVKLRTDDEVRLRNIFRNAPPDVRNRMMGSSLSIPGEILEIQAPEPENLAQPLELKVAFKEKKFIDFEKSKSQEIEIPLPKPDFHRHCKNEGLSDLDHPAGPVLQTERLKLTLPPGCTAIAPVPIMITREYGSYRSEYSREGNVLIVQRELTFKPGRLPESQSDSWDAFHRAVKVDLAQKVRLERIAPQRAPGDLTVPPGQDAESLANDGGDAIVKGNFPLALALLKAAVTKDPKHRHAWNNLGRSHAGMGQFKEAEEAYRKSIAINPFDEFAYNNLGITLAAMNRLGEAEAAYRKQIEVNPLDGYAHFNLGSLLLRLQKVPEALEALERADRITPNDTQRQMALAEALTRLGQRDRARGIFEALVERNNNPSNWNNIAYLICEHGGDLGYAKSLAEGALQSYSARIRTIRLASNPTAQALATQGIAATMDTLGWIHHQQGDQEMARLYVETSFNLSPSAEVGMHLGQLFEDRKEMAKAIAVYAGALLPSTVRSGPNQTDLNGDLRRRLKRLTGSDALADAAIEKATRRDVERRTVFLDTKHRSPIGGLAYIAMGPGNRVLEVHLTGEIAGMAPGLSGAIEKAVYPSLLQGGLPVEHVVLCGLVALSPEKGQSTLTLLTTPLPFQVLPPLLLDGKKAQGGRSAPKR